MESIRLKAFARKSTIMLFAACLLMVVSALGDYEIPCYTIDGGSGASKGEQYTPTGIIGQPDATYNGDDYKPSGGFGASAVTDCFPSEHPDYAEWLAVGAPDCWCYPRQCHGDADNAAEGESNYWVAGNDLTILKNAWNKPIEEMAGADICADFDHSSKGKLNYRVSSPDLTILQSNWNIPNGPDPNCFEGY